MHCRSVTANVLALVGILIEPSTSIAKPKGYIEASVSISKTHITVTSSSPIISSSFARYLFLEVC